MRTLDPFEADEVLPNLVEAVLAGREPSGLSLAKLTQSLPVLCDEQRELFGFPLL